MKIIPRKNDSMLSTAKLYMLKLVPKLKTNKSLKLLQLIWKQTAAYLWDWKWQGWHKSKQKCLVFIVVPRVRTENQISWIS